jgi:hypothetical protein
VSGRQWRNGLRMRVTLLRLLLLMCWLLVCWLISSVS